MVKATELMLGDWVVWKPQRGGFIGIVGGDRDFTPQYEKVKSRHLDSSLTNYDPIPLTPEILEKNGFIYDGHIIGSDGYDCKSYNINDSQVWGYLAKEGFDIAFGGHNQPSGIILPYVHTLQHALRLCGLDELADNFKID